MPSRCAPPRPRPAREQTPQRGITTLNVQRYELVIVERVSPAAANVFVRSNEVDAAVDKVEDSTIFVRDQVVPNVRAQKGFRALLMGVDRQSGHCLVSSIWETAGDLEVSEAAVREQHREAPLRIRWLMAYPACRVVRPSIALRRPLVFWLTCGITFRSRFIITAYSAVRTFEVTVVSRFPKGPPADFVEPDPCVQRVQSAARGLGCEYDSEELADR